MTTVSNPAAPATASATYSAYNPAEPAGMFGSCAQSFGQSNVGMFNSSHQPYAVMHDGGMPVEPSTSQTNSQTTYKSPSRPSVHPLPAKSPTQSNPSQAVLRAIRSHAGNSNGSGVPLTVIAATIHQSSAQVQRLIDRLMDESAIYTGSEPNSYCTVDWKTQMSDASNKIITRMDWYYDGISSI